jgi:TetR/AcrR family transcriptional regulator
MSATAHRRPRGRPRTGDEPATTDQVLAAALRAFARHGYDGVSIRTLSQDLGVSHNMIPHRFGGKERLWRAAVDWGFGNLVADLAPPAGQNLTDPLDDLRAGIRRFLEHSAAHPELLALMNIEGATDSHRLDHIFDNYVAPATAPLGRALEQLAAAGRIRPIPLRTLHFLITSGGAAPFSLAPLARRFDPADPLDGEHVRAHAGLVADIITAGLRTDPGAVRR